jgi:hypothetical protein
MNHGWTEATRAEALITARSALDASPAKSRSASWGACLQIIMFNGRYQLSAVSTALSGRARKPVAQLCATVQSVASSASYYIDCFVVPAQIGSIRAPWRAPFLSKSDVSSKQRATWCYTIIGDLDTCSRHLQASSGENLAIPSCLAARIGLELVDCSHSCDSCVLSGCK